MTYTRFQIKVNLSEELYLLLKQKSKRLGLRVSEQVRNLIIKEVEKDLQSGNLKKEIHNEVDDFLDSLR